MYLEYFSLKRHPFRITPDPSLFFAGGAHGRGVVLDALVYGITTGEGILKVVGEVGSGKTMLCRMLEERLPANVEIVYLANPNLTARDIVYAIAFELKLEVDSATDRLVVMHKLQDYLLKRHAEGGSVVVFIEEAQGMPLETLEEIRLLSNLETHRHKLMQIVMFGQPELDRKLQNKAIRQLRERITHSFNLDPLSEDEIREYLHFRLQTAGCPWPQLFSPNAEKLLAKASGGLTRRINILADKALLAAYADPSVRQDARNSAGEILPMVLPRHVKIALADSGYQRFKLPALPAWVVYGTTGLALLVLLYFGLQQAGVLRPPETSPGDAVALVTERSGVVERAAQPVVEPMAPPTSPSAESVAAAPDLVEEAEPQAAVEPAAASSAMAVGEAPPAPTPEAAPPEVAATSTLVDEPVLIADPEPEPVPDSTVDVPQAAAAAAPASAPAVPPAAVVDTPPAAASVEEADDIVPPGLAGQRHGPSLAWLNSLTQKDGYTIQMYSISTRQPDRLEEFLEFLELTGLLDNSYICVISGNTRRQEQWLVMHGEFAGLSDARRFIRELPPYLRQYQPYARNLDDIACAE